ncbi:MAG: hypothetical protein EOO30_09755 [Comamonadaceae bacterium]|nr:MAG: hypothetical protein EOO30_09755 [Comamonadaceae bacterium]
MASSSEFKTIRTGSLGRGFASMDPERQGEVPGRLIRTSDGPAAARARAARLDWMQQVQPDRDTSMFEGSSSRHSR